MKITTLACIQGAWLPVDQPSEVLDIGAGTGILSLMIAQRYTCTIDAVEIEDDAFEQLQENIGQSPWKNSINCYHSDIQTFAKHTSKKYDLIISNPPFYENQLKSENPKRNLARHETSLTISELVNIADDLSGTSGKISVLLPPVETENLIGLTRFRSLFVSNQLIVSDSEQKPPKAVVTILTKEPTYPIRKHLHLKNEGNTFTKEYKSLLKDYYLYI